MTLKEIAQELGLSSSTVSRVLNGQARKYRISERTEKSIQALVTEHGFTPNLLARNLRLQRTDTVGLIIPDISNPFFANLGKTLEIELRKKNQLILLCDTHEQSSLEQESLSLLTGRKVDGLLIAPVGLKSHYLNDLSIPTILIDRYFTESPIPFVSTNNFEAAFHATNYLIERGHQKISCIQGLRETIPNQERIRGFNQAMKEANLLNSEINQAVGRDFSSQSGYEAVMDLIRCRDLPTALFTFSNQIAIGAISALKDHDLSIPDDVSIISFDDQSYFELTNPPITSIQQPIEQIAKRAVTMLLNVMAGKQAESKLIESKIIERSSVKYL